MPSRSFQPPCLRALTRSTLLLASALGLAACSLANLAELSSGPPTSDEDADTPPPSTNADEDASVDEDSPFEPGSETGTDSGPPTLDASIDAEVPVVTGLYAPPAGNYQYVQNTAAYTTEEFPGADPSKLGIDYIKIKGTCGSIPATRPQVDPMPATIVREPESAENGVCWTFHLDIRPNDDEKGGHQEDVSFCARDGGLYVRPKDTTVQHQFWIVPIVGKQTAVATTQCDRTSAILVPTMKPGDVWSQTCTGTTTAMKDPYTSAGPLTYVGLAVVNVGAAQETAYHVIQDRTVTGGMKGREVTDFYLSMLDGMPLRIHRWTHIETPTGFPCITTAVYDNYGSDYLLKERPKPPDPPAEDAGTDADANAGPS